MLNEKLINDEFLNKIKLKFNEEDINLQQEYFKILDKLIDAIIILKYEDKKTRLFEFNFVNEINDFLLYNFDQINDSNRGKILESVIKRFNSLEKNIATTAILTVYKIYLENNQTLPQEHTIKIYNYILNEQQNAYFSAEKEKITKVLKKYFPLSKKKEKVLSFAAKRETIIKKMQKEKYDEIGFSIETLKNTLEKMHQLIDDQPPLNILTKEEKNQCDELFLKGQLDEEILKQICPFISKKQVKKILAKYNKLLLDYAEQINIEYKINPRLIEFNYNHLNIISGEKYEHAFKRLDKALKLEEKQYISEHKDELQDILKLLSFTRLHDLEYYFNINIFKSLLLNYPVIKNHLMCKNKNTKEIDFNYLLNHLKEVIRLAKIYHQTDEVATSILGEETIEKIILNNQRTSCKPYDYVEVYKKILERTYTQVPPISFYYRMKGNVYKIESGNNYDLERLLIGKNCYNSCLSPEGSGEKAYMECLTKNSGDVIIIRNAKTNEFRARCLVFRRGNTLVLANILDNKKRNHKFYNQDFLYTLGNLFLQSAQRMGDNLEYVLINDPSSKKENNYVNLDDKNFYIANNCIRIKNKALQATIPHCDVEEDFLLIGTTKNGIKINPKASNTIVYSTPRKTPVKKRKDYIEDIKKIKAIQIAYSKEQDQLRKDLNKINKNYKAVYVGQDFYIAVDENHNIESVKLPVEDERQKQEIDECLNDLVTIEMNTQINSLQEKKVFAKK